MKKEHKKRSTGIMEKILKDPILILLILYPFIFAATILGVVSIIKSITLIN